MKNILFISPEYPPETGAGGIGTYVYEMAKAIKRHNQVMEVSVLSVSFEKSKRTREEDIEVIRVKANRHNPLGVYWAISWWLLRNYRKYDLIEDEIFGGYAVFAKMILGKKYKYIARLHGTSHEVYSLERKNSLKYLIFRTVLNLFEKFIVKRARLIIANSSLMGVYSFFLWNIDFSRMSILPLPITLEKHETKCGILPEKLVGKDYFLFYGSLQKKKGSAILKRIIERIMIGYPEALFVIVGRDCEGMSGFFEGNDRVIFLGYIGEKGRLHPIIKNAKLVILPSQFESFLYTAVESITLGTPTIITRNCGVAEYIRTFSDYDNVVTSQNDENEFMEKIDAIIENYAEAKVKTALQREYFAKCFSPELITGKYVKLINENYGKERGIC